MVSTVFEMDVFCTFLRLDFIAERNRFASRLMVTELATRVRYSKLSTLLNFGSCHASSFARTISTVWAQVMTEARLALITVRMFSENLNSRDFMLD